ncbi:MAG: hypothetical protein ACFBZ8_08545 [Opitutales bacterium]
MFFSRLCLLLVLSALPTAATQAANVESTSKTQQSVATFIPEKAQFWNVLGELGFPVPFSSWFESDLIPFPTKFLAETGNAAPSKRSLHQSSSSKSDLACDALTPEVPLTLANAVCDALPTAAENLSAPCIRQQRMALAC